MKNRKGRLCLGKQESAVTPVNMAEVQDLIDQIQDKDAREDARKAVAMTWNYLSAMVKEHNEEEEIENAIAQGELLQDQMAAQCHEDSGWRGQEEQEAHERSFGI
tara:strand:- start:1056 stop:1370 length:315 start_codon:yes stop_codon:yes gene_type:complete